MSGNNPENSINRGRVESRLRVRTVARALGTASLALLMAVGGASAEAPGSSLRVEVSCLDSNVVPNDSRFVLPPGIRVSIKGEYPKMEPSPLIPMGGYSAPKEVVWLTVEDGQGTTRTLTYGALQADNATANMDRYLSSIRQFRKEEGLQGDPNYIRPFKTYRIRMGTGLNTQYEQPRITHELASAAFSANCVMGPKGEIFPYWSFPNWARLMPMRISPLQLHF